MSLIGNDTSLKGSLAWKGERGFSAYEIAVKNGFIGSEKDWLAHLGTSSHFSENSTVYTATAGQTSFNIPSSYVSGCLINVYVNGFKLNLEEFVLNLDTMKIELVNSLDAGAVVEVVVKEMSTNELPILSELTPDADDKTVVSSKYIFNNLPVSVKTFGAKGDGVTDDTEAIQNALNTYNNIYFPDGEYVISRPLYFETKCKHIHGTGVKTSIIRKVGHLGLAESKEYTYKEGSTVDFANYDALMIAGDYSGDFTIENLGFQGDADGKTEYGLLLGFTYRTTLNNLHISQCGQNVRYFVTWNTNIKKVRSQHGLYGFRIEGVNDAEPEQSTSVHFDNTFAEYCKYGYKGVNLTYFTGSSMSADFIDEVCHWYKYCQGSINGMGIEQSSGQFIRNWLSNINISGAFFLSNLKKATQDSEAKSTAKIEVWSENRDDTGLLVESGEFRNVSGEGIDTLVYVDGNSYLLFNNIRLSGVRNTLPEEGDVIKDGSIFNINGRSISKITSVNTIIDGSKSLMVGEIDMKTSLMTYDRNGESRILPDKFVWLQTTADEVTSISIPISEIQKRYPNFMYKDTYIASPHRLSVYCNNGALLTDIFVVKKDVKTDNMKRFNTETIEITSATVSNENLVLTFNVPIKYIFVYITSI